MANTTYTSFGLEAKKIMLERGMTMTALAKELEISNSYLSEIFTGRRKGKKQQDRIANILGLEIIRPAS